MRTLLIGTGATWLVSSAACGADLIALSEAGKLGIRRRVGLPFSLQKSMLRPVKTHFRVTCREILEAAAIGKERRQDVGAVLVWDGNVRETLDYTSEFAAEAKTRGIPVFEIRTM